MVSICQQVASGTPKMMEISARSTHLRTIMSLSTFSGLLDSEKSHDSVFNDLLIIFE